MRFIAAALLATGVAWADGPAVSPPADPPPSSGALPSAPASPGDTGVFLLRGGGTVAGRFVASRPGGDEIELRSGERVTFAAGSVVGRIGALPDLSGDERERDPVDPGRGRYLHVPSALALEGGELAVTASAAALPAVDVGVVRWLSAAAAFSCPTLYGTPVPGPGAVASVALRGAVRPWLRASAGVQGIAGDGGAAAVLFGAVTAGTPAAHVTVYAGPPLPEAGRLGRFEEVVLAVAGSVRIAPHVAVLAEGWLTPRSAAPAALLAGAARLHTRRFSIDLGWLQSSDREGAPWIALGWRGTWNRE